MSISLPLGKIDAEILSGLMGKYTHRGDRVLIGAGIGEDAAVMDMGEVYLVAKTDPITHVTREIGYYAVHVNANDIAGTNGMIVVIVPCTSVATSGRLAAMADAYFSRFDVFPPHFHVAIVIGFRAAKSCYELWGTDAHFEHHVVTVVEKGGDTGGLFAAIHCYLEQLGGQESHCFLPDLFFFLVERS